MQQKREEGSKLTLVPAQRMYPQVLPPETREFFAPYDNGDTSENGVSFLLETLARDKAYLRGQPENPNDPHLQEIRFEQAGTLQKHIQRIGNVLRYNFLYLGRLLIEASDRYLYEYLGYRSVEEWCETVFVDGPMVKKAMQLEEIWRWMRPFGYTVVDVVDGRITEQKIHLLKQLKTEKKHEYDAQAVAVYTEHYPLPQVDDPSKTKTVARAVQRAIDRLPDDKEEKLREEIQDRYIEQMRSAIDHIRVHSIGVLIKEQEELKGFVRKSRIILEVTRRQGNTIEVTSTFTCGESEAYAMCANQAWIQFHVPGQPFMSMSEFGDYLTQEGWPEED